MSLEYAAGLFEGEGTVGHWGRGWTAAIMMNDLEPLLQFQDAVGFGVVTTAPRPYGKERRVRHTWRTDNYAGVEKLFDLIGFWLSPRRRFQFEHALLVRPHRYSPYRESADGDVG